ncbi:MAG: bifunctional riboflavin kinase/FAD synthetase [Firmicutes bacterium]|nr:bifunctional riboflavin kinase/FAD synthetase [Bacillota bacterium]
MIVKNSFQGLKNKFRNIVVGMGNFDGVHIGHQKLIKNVVKEARSINGTAVVFTFSPHPLAVLNPEKDPPKLLSQQNKEHIIGKLGVDVVLSIPFDMQFAKISPDEFIRKVLYEELNVRRVVVGYNFSFGNMGKGTPETLNKYSDQYGYLVNVISPVTLDNQVVSSTVIRGLILEGNVDRAAELLGYTPFLTGTVITGERRGNTIGFPTANLNLDNKMLVPANGVYSVHVKINGDTYLGVANIGCKPTFNNGNNRNLEVHLLDFSGDLYGQEIRVSFIRHLRSEQKFNSVNELINQIRQDIEMALSDRQL